MEQDNRVPLIVGQDNGVPLLLEQGNAVLLLMGKNNSAPVVRGRIKVEHEGKGWGWRHAVTSPWVGNGRWVQEGAPHLNDRGKSRLHEGLLSPPIPRHGALNN